MTPTELFARHPEALARLDARLADYLATLAPAQRVEADSARQVIELVDGDPPCLSVSFDLDGGLTELVRYDATTIGLHVIAGEIVYVPAPAVAAPSEPSKLADFRITEW